MFDVITMKSIVCVLVEHLCSWSSWISL